MAKESADNLVQFQAFQALAVISIRVLRKLVKAKEHALPDVPLRCFHHRAGVPLVKGRREIQIQSEAFQAVPMRCSSPDNLIGPWRVNA